MLCLCATWVPSYFTLFHMIHLPHQDWQVECTTILRSVLLNYAVEQ
eukprot:SAG25_NODE_9178_length_384_cov_0.719298_1_plen_45_part_10